MSASGLYMQLHGQQHVCTQTHIDKAERGGQQRGGSGLSLWVDSIGAACPGQPGTVVSLCLLSHSIEKAWPPPPVLLPANSCLKRFQSCFPMG